MYYTQKAARFLLVFLLFIVTWVTRAQTGMHFSEMEGVDRSIAAFMQKWNITGGSVAISKDGNLVYSRGFGFADQARTRPTQPADQFRIASISKPITAVAVMKLVDRGLLNLDARAFGNEGILTDLYYTSAISDPRIYDVTVRQLLEHTAGWDRNIPYGPFRHSDAPFFPLYVTETFDEPNPVGDSTLIRFTLSTGLNYAPGTHYSYSNVGYLVLGKIIEKVSGLPYERFVKQEVLEPVGAFNTALGSNLYENKLPREVEYISDATMESCYGTGTEVPAQYGGFNLEAMNAHGGWVSTAPDLARLLVALNEHESGQLLSPGAMNTMTTGGAVHPSYALGWSVNSKGNMWHTGSLDGSSAFAASTADGYSWVLLFNGRSDNSGAFWRALDRLPRQALALVDSFPDVNLFAPAGDAGELAAYQLTPGELMLSWKNEAPERRLVFPSEKTAPVQPVREDSVDENQYSSVPAINGFAVYAGSVIPVLPKYEGSEHQVLFNWFEQPGQNNRFRAVQKFGPAAVLRSKTSAPVRI